MSSCTVFAITPRRQAALLQAELRECASLRPWHRQEEHFFYLDDTMSTVSSRVVGKRFSFVATDLDGTFLAETTDMRVIPTEGEFIIDNV